MLKKVFHWIFGLCTFAGFFVAFGTAGSSDLNLIDFDRLVVQYGIALALMLIGFVGLKLSGWEYID